MADRPWVKPEEVKAYTEYPNVQVRDDSKLEVDISRAEQYVISYTNNSFNDLEYPKIPEQVKTAVILIAEMYAFVASEAKEGKGSYKSESFDEYSYTAATTSDNIDNLALGSLLDNYVIAEAQNTVVFRLRRL